MAAELRFSAPLSSQVTLSASRPNLAAQKPLATTATPPGTSTTLTTPGTAAAALASKALTVAPNCGGRLSSATNMPGNATSNVNCAVPLTLAGTSTRGTLRPMSLKSFGSLSVTLSGTGSFAALPASAPKLAWRCVLACETTPLSTVNSEAGTFHSCAAAVTSMTRALAPASRSWFHEFAMDELPPVPCNVPKTKLA